jgi:hypothetical protein
MRVVWRFTLLRFSRPFAQLSFDRCCSFPTTSSAASRSSDSPLCHRQCPENQKDIALSSVNHHCNRRSAAHLFGVQKRVSDYRLAGQGSLAPGPLRAASFTAENFIESKKLNTLGGGRHCGHTDDGVFSHPAGGASAGK